MIIETISFRTAYDSRAEKTISIELAFKGGIKTFATVPAGKSRGIREAAVLPIERTGNALQVLARELYGRDFKTLKEFDRFLLRLDPTPTKEHLGGNVLLGTSIAFARGLAAERHQELWEVLNEEFFGLKTVPAPKIFSNLVNGGAHAANSLDIQEFMVVVDTAPGLAKSFDHLVAFYRQLGATLKAERKIGAMPIGDEGGYDLDFKNNEEVLELMGRMITSGHYDHFRLGLDVAASNFFADGQYRFEKQARSGDELLAIFSEYPKKFPFLMSIEDPFDENDPEHFKALLKKVGPGMIVVGDDLTVTNPGAVETYAKEKAISGVIIKANQVGTLTETCEAIRAALEHNVRPIVSHRSGETGDHFLIHIARASGAYGVKIGAPVRERIEKYNELLRIYG